MDANIAELIAAIKEEIPPPGDQTNLQCHRGITTAEKCSRCSRVRRVYAAIEAIENSDTNIRLNTMAKHVPSHITFRQARNGEWNASVWFLGREDAEFWDRMFETVMQKAAKR